jgi:long-subunit acyl-CoA synthetase (AMP-forming)
MLVTELQQGVIALDNCEGHIKFSDLLKDDGSAFPQYEYNVKDDVAFILFSSGTSGLPKGVMLTHYNLMANLMQIGYVTLTS